MINTNQDQDEYESRTTTVYAKNKQAAIFNRLAHFPRAELLEVQVLEPTRGHKNGKYHVVVSEDLD